MKMIKKILVFLGILFTFSILVNATQDAPQKPLAQEVLEDKLINDYNVYAIPMPDNLNFSGELVPIENPDIRERMDRELLVNTYWQSNGLLLFKRANKYFPIIEPILKEEGVPDDFKYLAVIESSLTQAVSPARATGFWQILKGTAKEYGLEVNQNVDERYHIEKSTRVACKYLKSAKKKFGSWTLAAAAYNAGRAGVNRQLERQNAVSYYDLEQITDFNEFAKKHNINYKILKLHNPWLREAHLNNTSGKEYYIQIPREGYYKTGTGQ